jgi:carboxymethylenebutenolidase
MPSRSDLVIKLCAAFAAATLLAACGGSEQSAQSSATAAAPSSAVQATAAEHAHDAPTSSPVAEQAPKVPVLEQELAYGEAQKRNLVGFLAMPRDAAEPLPGIIVIHEWWGLNDNIKAATRRLAGEGYVALAVDLYGGKTAATPEEAQALMTALVAEPEAARANLRQAYEYLEKYAVAPRIGSIGWCLGGGWSLQTALLFPDQLDAMVMYYGQLVDADSELETLKMPLLGFFGALDESIPVRQVQDFRDRLRSLGKNAQVLIYANANHAFANPSGGNYDEKAATESWQETLKFLDANLKIPKR